MKDDLKHKNSTLLREGSRSKLQLLAMIFCSLLTGTIADQITCKENTPVGSPIYDFKYHGNDSFRLLSVNRQNDDRINLQRLFQLSNDGLLLVASEVDRESLCPDSDECTLKLEIIAESQNGSMKLLHYLLNIEDENDELPRFDQPLYHITLSEFHPIGQLITLPCAIDMDSDKYSIHSVNLKTHGNSSFKLVPNSNLSKCPSMVLTEPLDAEIQRTHHLALCAYESNVNRFACCKLEIEVHDENDNSPTFSTSVYNFSIVEGEMPDEGRALGRVQASDPDKLDENKIRYRLVGNRDITRLFRLDAISGMLTVAPKVTFDREACDSYTFSVEARDSGDLYTRAHVIVNILDRNDNSPEIKVTFSQANVLIKRQDSNTATIELKENITVGTQIALVQCSDRDSGSNGRLQVSLGVDNKTRQPFTLISESPKSFMLTLASSLDCEVSDFYRIWIIAKDKGQPVRLSTKYSINLHVADVNDNDPVFEAKTYQFTVAENKPAGTQVGVVKAEDLDRNSMPLLYTMEDNGDTNQFFLINNQTGVITTKRILDRELKASYSFFCIASDGQGRKARTEVRVIVDDDNDNAPKLDRSEYLLAVEENIHYNKPLKRFQSKDLDHSPKTKYFIKEVGAGTSQTFLREHFLLNSTSGELWLIKPLDRETIDKIVFRLLAVDEDKHELRSEAKVTINILDENDNAPKILYPKEGELLCSGSLQHSEDPVNSIIIDINATDIDRGINGGSNLVFILNKPKENAHLHKNRLKIIKSSKGLNTVHVQIKVCDRGRPVPLCTLLNFAVLFTDDKSNWPANLTDNDFCKQARLMYHSQEKMKQLRHLRVTITLVTFLLLVFMISSGILGFMCFNHGGGNKRITQSTVKNRMYERPCRMQFRTNGLCTTFRQTEMLNGSCGTSSPTTDRSIHNVIMSSLTTEV